MKKIFLLILPLFVCIAILFTLQSRQFDFIEFVNVVSEWDFADSLDAFVDMRDTFNEVGNIWNSITSGEGVFDTIAHIGELFVTMLVGFGQLLLAIGYLVIDFVDNIIQIVEYLFIYEYVPLS